MKKLLILCLIALSVSAQAQKRFESTIKVGYDLGIDVMKNKSFGASFIESYKFRETTGIGLGVGISWCEHLLESGSNLSKDYRENAAYAPVFVNIKHAFIENSITPYIQCAVGYSFYIPFSDFAKDNKLGVFVSPSVGVDFPLRRGKLFAELSYKYQKMELIRLDNDNYSQMSFSIGYSF